MALKSRTDGVEVDLGGIEEFSPQNTTGYARRDGGKRSGEALLCRNEG